MRCDGYRRDGCRRHSVSVCHLGTLSVLLLWCVMRIMSQRSSCGNEAQHAHLPDVTRRPLCERQPAYHKRTHSHDRRSTHTNTCKAGKHAKSNGLLHIFAAVPEYRPHTHISCHPVGLVHDRAAAATVAGFTNTRQRQQHCELRRPSQNYEETSPAALKR